MRKTPVAERLWLRVVKSDAGCWEWNDRVDESGYGRLSVGMGKQRAHRVSWALHFGPIPAGLCVLHRCDNRRCVRPDHLFLGTRQDNNADMMQKGRDRHPVGSENGMRRHPEAHARGAKHGMSRLVEADIPMIWRRHSAGSTIAAIARDLGVGETTVRHVIQGKTWRHVQ